MNGECEILTVEQAPTVEQKHYRTLQAMLHSRRRLKPEERSALDYACVLIAQRVGEQALES